MLILHTSDWHLGRSFHGTGMLEAQREVLAQLAETVRDRGVDLVLVAGDVYDRALPSADAVELLDHTLAELSRAGARVVLTSGNHDSAIRLGFGGHLMDAAGVHLRTRLDGITEPVVLEDPDGGRVAVYGVPYLEPRQAGQSWGVPANHTAVTAEAVRRIREDAQARFGPRAEAAGTGDGGTALVVMAHLFAAGGAGSDSERDIGAGAPAVSGDGAAETGADGDGAEATAADGAGRATGGDDGAGDGADGVPAEGALVGTLGQVPVSVFEGVDYTALGHLHGRQAMTPTVRYSGSPLPYSFSEAGHVKGGLLVSTAGGAVTGVETVDWTAGRQLAVLRGRIDDLLQDPAHAWAEDRWCQVTVTDPVRPPQAYRRLKERFEGLLNFILEPEGGSTRAPSTYAARIAAARSELEVCTGFVDHVRQRPASESETGLLREALAGTRTGGEA
ncbi:exonuclease SbcCD subunit D [Citricoccus sp. SGAir0253]|uniref:exonuclease SbcCD subunit D n=1 Tax=Citricoccus sp. SGAir0253 TaxID=2567881 RepID=UPI0010CCC3EB|nr:exonuclease SbcCD subunit D [Citricoccus sp. SGAir0253]QCU78392.1 exonuclease SbcCD subunit D [Citricoccus sp. SGAir0253]